MSTELIAVLIGGILAMTSGIVSTILNNKLGNRRKKQACIAFARAEVIAIKEKAERYVSGKSNIEELKASTPIYSSSLALDFGFLNAKQIAAFRKTVTLDMEMRKVGQKNKAMMTIEACEKALELIQ